jgi:hypothetical protein
MTRQPHDQFAKQYLAELLTPLGTVEVSREVSDEARQIDLYFAPAPTPPTEPPSLGLLSKLVSSPCLIEPFRNQPLAKVDFCPPRACFQTLDLPVSCEEDPPQPPLKRQGQFIVVREKLS